MHELYDIAAAEQVFDSVLPRPPQPREPSSAVSVAGHLWSERVWKGAAAAGPVALAAPAIERGFQNSRRPIFICGAHRSGTTLMRDLLDGHPEISVLPSEGSFFTSLEPRLRGLAAESRLPSLGMEWVRRLANPINQPPYWLLGRTEEEASPYVTFARTLMAWWPLVHARLGAVTYGPLVAVALAYAHCSGALSRTSKVARWAEKTPANEPFLERLQKEFPHAQFIQLVRHPAKVYASRKMAEPRLHTSMRARRRVLQELAMSYRLAAAARSSSGRFIVVKYEDLVADTRHTMQRVAEFLGVEFVDSLMMPTVAGLASHRNSSFGHDAAPGRVQPESDDARQAVLSARDQAFLAATTHEVAAALGYNIPPLSAWHARWARLQLLLFSQRGA